MKILFVQPGLLETNNQYPPVGILSLASVVREKGHKVDFYDCGAKGHALDTALDFAMIFQPDIICTSLYTIGLPQQFDFLHMAKKKLPNCTTIVGGAHATALPIHSMAECSSIDFLVFGEGERTLVELLDAIKRKNVPEAVTGCCYRKNGDIIQNKPRELIGNLDKLPFPAFDLLNKHRFNYTHRSFNLSNKVGVIISSRGCPFSCSFCFKATFGEIFRRRSAQNVVAEMKWQIEVLKVEEIQFLDDLFAVNSKWLNDFFDELNKQDIKIPWKCLARVTSVTEDDLLKMRKHGCYGVEFGVESGNDEILKIANKKITTEQIRKAFRAAKKAGLVTFGFFIFGLEKDTHKTVKQTMELAKEIHPDACGFANLLPFPGSQVYSCLPDDLKYNWVKFNSYYDKKTLPFSICSISPEELLKYSAQANDEVNGSAAYLFHNVIFRKNIPLTTRKEALKKWYASTKKLIKLSISRDRTFLDNGGINFVYLLRDILLVVTVFFVTLPYRALTLTKRTKR